MPRRTSTRHTWTSSPARLSRYPQFWTWTGGKAGRRSPRVSALNSPGPLNTAAPQAGINAGGLRMSSGAQEHTMKKHVYEHVAISPRGVYRVTVDEVPGGYHVQESCPRWSAEHTFKEQARALDWAEHLAELHNHDAAEDERAEARNLDERRRAVLAMDYLARQVNDETDISIWLEKGAPDGSVPYGELDPERVDYLDELTDPETFAELLDAFTETMSGARKHGGLSCGGVAGGKMSADERREAGTRKASQVLTLVSSTLDDLAAPHLFAGPEDVTGRWLEYLAGCSGLTDELRDELREVVGKVCDLVSKQA